MAPDSNTWKPPVLFHFSVEFQWADNSRSSASFAEVEGLSQEIVFSNSTDGMPELPMDVKVANITLKRSLEPLNEKISQWVSQCFNFLNTGWITPCKLIVSLLDEGGEAIAAWTCIHAVPFKWNLNPLNASESRIAIESLTLRYTELIRNK